MSRVASNAGYTIIEVMIVLAVSGLLIGTIAASYSKNRDDREFETSTQETRQLVQQALADVDNGYFPSSANYNCSYVTAPRFPLVGVVRGQGTSSSCVFLGKALQFKASPGSPEDIRKYTVAGDASAQSIAASQPFLAPRLTESLRLNSALATDRIKVNGSYNFTGVAFLMDPGTYGVTGGLQSGRQAVRVYGIQGPLTGNSLFVGNELTDQAGTALTPVAANANGVQICFSSNTTNHMMLLTVGANGVDSDISTKVTDSADCGI